MARLMLSFSLNGLECRPRCASSSARASTHRSCAMCRFSKVGLAVMSRPQLSRMHHGLEHSGRRGSRASNDGKGEESWQTTKQNGQERYL
eukprot:1402826-Pleurochrysis_carterae.AAC.1